VGKGAAHRCGDDFSHVPIAEFDGYVVWLRVLFIDLDIDVVVTPYSDYIILILTISVRN
jgi:hypothetical protein